MCGIGGIISEKSSDNIRDFMKIVTHRGPDFTSTYNYKNVTLGHNRLSIIDLSESGNQPMKYASDYIITYNGEIYNYIELREELKKLGCVFHTQSDTEVLLAAYEKWGFECLHKFNGMWAFAILDLKKKILFCSRDRFGVKPFYYYYINKSIFAFASEIKQFTTLPFWKSNYNLINTLDFLTVDITDHNEETMFKGVKNLRGGHNLIYNLENDTISIIKWYDLNKEVSRINLKLNNEEDTLKKLIIDSLKFRLRSDVKVGSCLSGGVDSSVIVCNVNEILNKELKNIFTTYSSCSFDKKFDEQEYMDLITEKTNFKTVKVFPTYENLINIIDKIIWHQDEPFSSTSIYAQWCLFQEARKDNTIVLLDGQGSDEIFAGYNNFFPPYFLNLIKQFKIINSLNNLLHYKRAKNLKLTGIIKNLLGFPVINNIKNLINKHSFLWLNNEYRDHYKDVLSMKRNIGIRNESYDQILFSNLPKLLRYEDRNSMAFSTEARVPFIDHRIVEFGCSLPDTFKINNGTDKYILRECSKEILPFEIYSRKEKLGFVTPERNWFFENYSEINNELKEIISLTNNLLNNNILKYCEDVYSGKRNYDQTLWKVLIFGKWIKTFNINF